MIHYKIEKAIRKMFREGQITDLPSTWTEEDVIDYLTSYGRVVKAEEKNPKELKDLADKINRLAEVLMKYGPELKEKISGPNNFKNRPEKAPYKEREDEEEKKKGVFTPFSEEELTLFGKQDPAEVERQRKIKELKEDLEYRILRIRQIMDRKHKSPLLTDSKKLLNELEEKVKEANSVEQLEEIEDQLKHLEKTILLLSGKKRPREKSKTISIETEAERALYGKKYTSDLQSFWDYLETRGMKPSGRQMGQILHELLETLSPDQVKQILDDFYDKYEYDVKERKNLEELLGDK